MSSFNNVEWTFHSFCKDIFLRPAVTKSWLGEANNRLQLSREGVGPVILKLSHCSFSLVSWEMRFSFLILSRITWKICSITDLRFNKISIPRDFDLMGGIVDWMVASIHIDIDMVTFYLLETVNETLFGKRVFSGIIKDLRIRLPLIIGLGPKSNNKYPYKIYWRRKDTQGR